MGAAIFRRGRLLLLLRSPTVPFPGQWEIPGGHVEEGETLEEALIREVKEETGFDVVVGRPFHAWSYRLPSRLGRLVPTVEIDFQCRGATTSTPRLDAGEHTGFAWVLREELVRYPTAAVLDAIHRRAFASR